MSTAATPCKPVRKFPPPCWTQDEALALIEAYRERWYALRRGYLRTADWDAVAEEVGRSCPGASPAKTSAQCRHKMEKLRQRYRAEKQRSLSYPGRFFSSWFYFEAMDAMENNGSKPEAVDLPDKDDNLNAKLNPGRGIRFKPVSDRNLVTLAVRPQNSRVKSSPNYGSSVVANDYSSYLGNGSDKEQDDDDGEFDGFLVETPIDENLVAHPGYRSKDLGKMQKSSSQNYASRFHVKPRNFQDLDSPGLRPRKFSKVEGNLKNNYWDDGQDNEVDANGEIWMKVPRDNRGSVPSRLRGKYSDGNSNPNFDTSGLNGYSSLGKNSGGGGIKRENSGIADMVSSIKLLGDGFMKMEKMKMDMAREIEKMRMETEMKRNELILESQKQIVDAFVKGLIENKKKKQKPITVATES